MHLRTETQSAVRQRVVTSKFTCRQARSQGGSERSDDPPPGAKGHFSANC